MRWLFEAHTQLLMRGSIHQLMENNMSNFINPIFGVFLSQKLLYVQGIG